MPQKSMQQLMDEMNAEIEVVIDCAVEKLLPVKPSKKFFMCQNIYVMEFASQPDYDFSETILSKMGQAEQIVRVVAYPKIKRIVVHV